MCGINLRHDEIKMKENMKYIAKLFVGMLFLMLGGMQSGVAQDIKDVQLSDYAITPADAATANVYVYLYNVTTGKFVHGGGDYGAQTILSDNGIRFKVVSDGNGYNLESTISNNAHEDETGNNNEGGGCLGVDIYKTDNNGGYETFVDKGKGSDEAKIHFSGSDPKGYQLYTTIVVGLRSHTYYYSSNNSYVSARTNSNSDKWCLIPLTAYNEFLKEAAKQQGRYDITGLIGNSRFLRNVKDGDKMFWSLTNPSADSNIDYCITIDPHLGALDESVVGEDNYNNSDTYTKNYGAFGCLEIGHVTTSKDKPVEVYQTIPNLTPGLYMVEAQAFFDEEDSYPYTNGAYNNGNTTGASNAYLFANGEETLIPMLSNGDHEIFSNDVTMLHDALSTDNQIYFRRNVAAAYFLAKGNSLDPDESFHRVRVYVNVGTDGTLTLGVNKKGTNGRVYVDNFSLYYIGDNGIGIDAYNREPSAVDGNKYQHGYPFHLSRKFVLNAWSAITLPLDVYAGQLKQTFGTDVKLCKLEGLNTSNPDQIMFDPVDLSNDDNKAIERGGCYLIWVTKDPEVPAYEEYTFVVKEENNPDNPSTDVKYQYGNIYTINDVSCPDGMNNPVTNTVQTTDGKLSYTYFYYRPDNAPAGSYVMSGGKMYHLPKAWDGLLGTCWYITDNAQSGNTLQLMVNGNGGTTDINGIVTELPGDNANEGVYNINGQKVADGTSLKGLPKGIYIVNGKKYVIK